MVSCRPVLAVRVRAVGASCSRYVVARLPGSRGCGRSSGVVALLTCATWPGGPVSRVRNPGPGTLRFSLMVGYDPAVTREVLLERETELAVGRGLVGRAAGGEGGGALIEGPRGIGKSSLLTEAEELAP